MTSDEALSLEEFPKRVVIVGGGYVLIDLFNPSVEDSELYLLRRLCE